MDWCERQRRALGRMRTFDSVAEVTKTFTITGSKDFLDRLERHLAFIQWLGGIGHSATAGIGVDGDGQDRIKIAEKVPSIKEHEVQTHGHYPSQWEGVS